MNIHEYQGKQIFARYGIPVPKGIPAFSAAEAKAAAEKLITETGNEVVVIKRFHVGFESIDAIHPLLERL